MSAGIRGGEAPLVDRRSIDHRHDAIDRDPVPDGRPGEGADQRLGQRQTRRLDDDVIRRRIARQQRLHRRQEFVGDRAADAAVGEFDDRIRPAVRVAAIAEQAAVEAHVAEFIDDDRDAAAPRTGDQVADQRRLAGAEKAGDDGRGDAGLAHAGAPKAAGLICSGMPAVISTTRETVAATFWLRMPCASA